jgi:hypothetical protein
VRRKVDDREVVCIVNTSGTTAVKIPKNYSSGWQNAFTHGLSASELGPFGFLVAQK